MKLKSVNGKTLGDNAPVVLGAVAGAMVGRGLTALASKPADPKVTTQAELDKKMYVQGGMAVAGYVGYAAIDGNDTVAQAAKGACLGIAIDNTIAVIGSLVGKSAKVTEKLAAETTVNRFAKAALGLGCPSCETVAYPTVAMNRPRRRSLGYPVNENVGLFEKSSGIFN